MNTKALLLLLSLSGWFGTILYADVTLPAIISDHMVLKKSAATALWGWAEPGEDIAVALGAVTAHARADDLGNWRLTLDLEQSSPGPFELSIQGKNKIVLKDVLVGEVWVASGQSNMEFTLSRDEDAAIEIPQSADAWVRQFLVTKATSPIPIETLKGTWMVAGPAMSGRFSAVGYYFAKAVRQKINQPVALIHTSWGGTPVESWTSREALQSVPELKETTELNRARADAYPELKAEFVSRFGQWLRDQDRMDKAGVDPALYAGEDLSPAAGAGWATLSLPGPVSGAGLPNTGAVWLRKEINIPAIAASTSMAIQYSAVDAFESVYWNGKLIHEFTYETYPGDGFSRRYDLPAKQVKSGRNVLALRVVYPVKQVSFTAAPKVGAINLSGEWLTRVEYALTDLDGAQKNTAPVAPSNPPNPPTVPSYLFNAMVYPILNYTITGVIWYQGETNLGRARQYRAAFPLLIADWRRAWNQGEVPFYHCQLPNYGDKNIPPGESGWAELREAQASVLSLPQTGQAVLIDVGESQDIHPRDKRTAGERLARVALARHYGRGGVDSGPVFDSARIEDGRVVVSFTGADDGLVARPLGETFVVKSEYKQTAPLVRNSPGSELEGFSICGADRKWVWAQARIQGETVVVWSEAIPAPVAVRYAWANNPTANLYNGAGLPAAPFRTDESFAHINQP